MLGAEYIYVWFCIFMQVCSEFGAQSHINILNKEWKTTQKLYHKVIPLEKFEIKIIMRFKWLQGKPNEIGVKVLMSTMHSLTHAPHLFAFPSPSLHGVFTLMFLIVYAFVRQYLDGTDIRMQI